MKKIRLGLVITVLLLLASVAVTCGGDDDDGSNSGSQPTATRAASEATATTAAPAATATTAAAPASTTAPAGGGGPISVSIVDFAFSPSTLTVQSGQSVTVNLRNNGSASHTFTIDGVADSGPLGGGESGSVTFTPAQAGSLTFYCTIHGASTMSGRLTVN